MIIEEDKKKLESKISEITRRNPKNRNKDQSDTIKNLEIFITQGKKLSNYIITMLKLHLKLCVKQNREKDLKY